MFQWVKNVFGFFRLDSKSVDLFEQIPGFKEAFAIETRDLGASRAKTLIIIGVFCYGGFTLVDWMLYPHLTSVFLPVRIGFCALLCASLAFSGTVWWRDRAATLLFFTALTGDLGISYLASQFGGWSSLYFVGNILVTTGITMFVPWRPKVTLLYCTGSFLSYVLVNRLFHEFSIEMLAPTMFLVVIAVQAYFSTVIDEANRKKQLAARFAVESAHAELKRQSTLLQQQIEAAKDIQQALLPPRIQDMQGLRIEAIYEPSEQLSGDFFDAVICGDWVYVYLADVTGHGLPAAQITFLVKEIFKTALTEELELPELFDVVRNKYAGHQLEYDLALLVVRIHTKSFQAEFLRSNAPNPVVIDEAGGAAELDLSPSPLISASVEKSGREPAKVTKTLFDPQTKIYFYSDGAYEFFTSGGREFGPRRLLKTFGATQFAPWPEGLRSQLLAENRDEFFPDDLTVLRIRVKDVNES